MAFRSDLKIILIGNSGTGKTQFVNRWTKNIFSDIYKATIVSEFGFKIFEHEGKLYRIQLWDLAGQDKNSMATKIFAKDAHGVVILSDATDLQTREDTLKWKSSVDEVATFLDGGKLPCILIENKCDLIEKNGNENYDDPTLKEYAASNGFIGAFIVSSKNSYNISESMEFLLKTIVKGLENIPINEIRERKSVDLKPEKHNEIIKKRPKKTDRTNNISDVIDNSLYNIDKIEFRESEDDDCIEICIYKDDDKTSYECKENFYKLRKKYEFLKWVESTEKLVEIFEKLNESKKIKINLCLDKILIHISILYTTFCGEVEEIKFILKYNDVEKEDILDLVISEMIKMKENEDNSKEKNGDSKSGKESDEEKEDEKKK